MKKTDKNKQASDKAQQLLEKAKQLQSEVSPKQKGQGFLSKYNFVNETEESIKTVAEGVGYFSKLILSSKEVLLGLKEKILVPIWLIFGPAVSWIWRQYCKFWNKFAYSTDKITGERVISRTKSSFVFIFLILTLSIFTPTTLGNKVRFFTVEPFFDCFAILITKKTETFFLNHSEEVDPERNVHAVRGCRKKGECTEKDAVYMRVKPRLSHDIWKLINYGNPFYVPDHVVAPIAPGVNQCEVTYYGYRMTSSWISRLLRSLELYPVMLEANCRYIGAEKKTETLQ